MNGTTVAQAPTENNDPALNKIWSHILQEVQNSTKKTPPTKSIILLGDNESGRSTLISRLKGVETLTKGIGLEYHYIEVKDEDRDDAPKLGVWVPDGDGTSSALLKSALNESNFENVMIIFVISMSAPWSMLKSLEKWSQLITEHINKLNIDSKQMAAYRDKILYAYQSYQEPDESNKAKDQMQQSQRIDTESMLPLDPNVLTCNLGVPCIVVVTKSDSIAILDKENEYKIEHFDFIQYHIRKFCLNYGAALFYTSVKDKRTYDKLYKYILHKLYYYPFKYTSSVVDRESIFIPSGWDNESKVNILLENLTTIKADSSFSDIIAKPNIRKPLQRDVDPISATDDQEFLFKLQVHLNKVLSTANTRQEDINTTTTATTPTTTRTPQRTTPTKPSSQEPDSTNLKSFFQNLLAKNTTNSASSLINNSNSSPIASSSNSTIADPAFTTTPVSYLNGNLNNSPSVDGDAATPEIKK